MKLYAHVNGRVVEMTLAEERGALVAATPSGSHAVALDGLKSGIRTAFIDGRRIEFGWRRADAAYLIVIEGIEYTVEVRDDRAERAARVRPAGAAAGGDINIKAPIPGRIIKVLVKAGDAVVKDQPLLTLDAMKLENEIPSPRGGTVKSVHVEAGVAVERGQQLVIIA